MKRTYVGSSFLMIGLLGLMILGGCAKNDGGGGGGGGGTVAQTPCNSPVNGSCDPSIYNQQPGLIIPAPQAFNTGFANGYCGCPVNTRPIYNPQWGFACAPADYLQYQTYLGYNINTMSGTLQGQNLGTNTIQQVYYSPMSYGGASNCYSNFASSCDVRAANSCPNAGQCRAIGGGSTIGVCTSGYGVDSYNGSTYYSPGYSSVFSPYMGLGGNCRYRTNSWGLTFYTCSPAYGAPYGGGVPR